MKKLFIYAGILFLMSAFNACTKGDTKPAYKEEKKIITAAAKFGSGYTLNLYQSTDSLRVGYNPVFTEILDDAGKKVTHATVQYSLLMHMRNMSHAAPVDNMVKYHAAEGLYSGGAAYFSMASNTQEHWAINVKVNLNDQAYTIELPIYVANAPYINRNINIKKITGFAGTDQKNYVLALVQPFQNFKIGMQELEVAVFKAESMIAYTPVDNLKLSFVPTMPSMNNHSSPNNVDPVFYANGHYKGRINFTMTGDWHLNFSVVSGADTLAKNVALDIYF